MKIITFREYGFFGNLYLSIVFSIYKIIDNRKIKNINLIENANIEIKHFSKIIITDKICIKKY